MKSLKSYFYLFMVSMAMIGLWGCSDDKDDPTPEPEETVKIEVYEPATDAVFATSATFKLDTKGAESYVYTAIEGSEAAEPDPALSYRQAEENNEVITVSGDTAEETVVGLEGNKTYTVFFIFKVGTEYEIRKQVITTPAYSQRLTVIETGMFSIKIHVEMPEDKYWHLIFNSVENYESYKQQFGYQDVDYVYSAWGNLNAPYYKGSQTLELVNNANAFAGALNEADYEADYYLYAIHPGTPYVLFVGECDENGGTDAFAEFNENIGGGDDPGVLLAQLPDVKEYTEESPTSEYVNFNGQYAKAMLFTKEPAKGNGSVTITADRITEKTAIISFSPTDDIFEYAVVMIKDSEKDFYFSLCGGEEKGVQASCLSYGEHFDGKQTLYYPIEKGDTYTIYAVGVCKEDGTVQTFDKMENIAPIESTLPASELKVTPLELNQPYQVGFNIKAPNRDCIGFVYLMNYTKDWWPTLNGLEDASLEAKIATMVSSYGQGVNDAEIMAQVNSEEGYDVYFSSMDDTESWIVLESYNQDEKTKLFYDGNDYKAKTAALVPEEPVNSDLFDKLVGNWNGSMTDVNGKTVTFPVEIAAGPQNYATMPEKDRESLLAYYKEAGKTDSEANKLVDDYFKEYQEKVSYYTQKNKNMNCLVANGFECNVYATYASPWDLFVRTDYSAYSTDDLFRDYGPKMYFKIEKDEEGKDQVSVITTRVADDGYNYYRYVDPLSAWYRSLILCAYNAESQSSFYTADFPVEISDDMNTVTIKTIEQDGQFYSPSVALEYTAGYPAWSYKTSTDGIVLTRATDDIQAMKTWTKSSSDTGKRVKVKPNDGNHFRRTRTPYDCDVKSPVEGSVLSAKSISAKYSKK